MDERKTETTYELTILVEEGAETNLTFELRLPNKVKHTSHEKGGNAQIS